MKTKNPHVHKQAPVVKEQRIPHEKWTADKPFLIAFGLTFCYTALHVLSAFLRPDYMFWGVNMLRYLPAPAMLLPVVALTAIAWVWFGMKNSTGPAKISGWISYVLVPVALVVVLILANIDAFLLGDAGNLTREMLLSVRGEHVATRAPLSLLFMRWMFTVADIFNPVTASDSQKMVSDVLTSTVRDGSNAELSFMLAGMLLIVVLYFILFRASVYFVEDAKQRVWFVLFILGSGTLAFFAGYMELYLLSYVLLVSFMLSMMYVLQQKKDAWLPVVLFAVTSASHVGLIVFAPALLLMLWHLFRDSVKHLLIYSVLMVIGVAGMLAVSGYSPETLLYIFAAKSTEAGSHFIPFVHTASKAHAYTAFSPYHFTDLLNLFLLVNPAGILIVLFFLPKIFREKLYLKPAESVLLLSVLLSLIMLFIANSDIGMVADWDFLALYIVPSILAGAWFLMRHGGASRTGILKLCSIALVLHTGLWLWNLADDQASIRRLTALQNPKTFSPDGLLYTTNHLTRYYSERNKFTEMLKPYERYISELNPDDARAYFSLSRLYTRMKRNDASEAVLRKAVERGIDDYRIDAALGDVYMARQQFDLAIPLYKTYLRRYPSTSTDSVEKGKGWFALARCYLAMDSLSVAVETYKQGLREDSENLEGMAQLAVVYLRTNAVKDAIPLLRKVVQNSQNAEQRGKAERLLKLCEG